MDIDWQSVIAGLIVIAAGIVLSRRVLQWWTASGVSGCGACPNKNANSPMKTLPLVQIQTTRPPK